MEKIYYAYDNQKKSWMAILMSDKINFKTKNCYKSEEGHFIKIKDQPIKKI